MTGVFIFMYNTIPNIKQFWVATSEENINDDAIVLDIDNNFLKNTFYEYPTFNYRLLSKL
jgi:hypothetical protein